MKIQFTPHKFLASILATSFIYIYGCKTVTPETIIPPTSDVEVPIGPSVNSITIADDYFMLKGTEVSLDSFTLMDSSADIQDLAAFGICTYRSKLQNAMQNGDRLTPFDIMLLEFCLDTQVSALDTFCNVEIAAMLQEPLTADMEFQEETVDEYELPMIFAEQKKNITKAAYTNFIQNKNVFYRQLCEWGNTFQPLGCEIIDRDINNILKGQIEMINNTQWRSIWARIDITHITYICSKIWDFDTDLFEEKSLRPYKKYIIDDDMTSINWRSLNTTLTFYISDIQCIYNDIHTYIEKAKDTKGKRDLENFLLIHDEAVRKAIFRNICLNNDFPFSVFCKKAFMEIQNCKNFYNDDEVAMEVAIHNFSRRASGADMLMQLRSVYTAMIYRQLLELAKSELGDRWENVKTTCKLYQLDEISPDFLGKNKLRKESHNTQKL